MPGETPTEGPGVRRRHIVAALVLNITVITALTLFKFTFVIAGLWTAAAHRTRDIRLIPFSELSTAQVWYGPPLNIVGNFALFLPFGALVCLLLRDRADRMKRTALTGFGLSLLIETLQFVFAVGYSDVDDLLFNTVGAAAGAWFADRHSPHRDGLIIGVSVVFVLIILILLSSGEWTGGI
ncbi:VanZ family protein [Corynebacterium sp. CCM 8835]|uniref:VanZ family protein n=1 Tax=Corynebacterium antarcticum TaxID=2800405 RepID=A0A9Q4CE18_9CORY|nr:VanZ family protein [Corynebacterium antarcticum]MCK7643034.1 VanZ family protein [Corynebacterium antarcticum]MCK7661537.1 VanZ family protein [Corynebacterium antarcticum]MCL0246280.1 VanZ family protein [Corynebacterium antarcticum]MCX7493021.1 VanZ family protein [Corynebacterium antarcticum]MCX7539091.1 VanZ family protein [Corynebacterium antarcticum]